MYTSISFINGVSEDDLVEQAYKLKADALMDLNLQKYTSTKVNSSFNGIGAQRAVRSKVYNHENWTAYAIKFNNSNYHEPFEPNNFFNEYINKKEDGKSLSMLKKIFIAIPIILIAILVYGMTLDDPRTIVEKNAIKAIMKAQENNK